MNIYQKLIEVRKSAPYLKKDNKGYHFSFVSSSQTLGTLRRKMDELGLLLVPSVLENSVSDHKTSNGGHEYFTQINIKFTWVNAEKPEEIIECMWIGQGLDIGEKGVGKALTYAEKYFLLKFFNIATDKDDPDSFQGKFTPVVIKTSADWETKFDAEKLTTIADIKKWRTANGKEILSTLNKQEQVKFKGYLKDCELLIKEGNNG